MTRMIRGSPRPLAVPGWQNGSLEGEHESGQDRQLAYRGQFDASRPGNDIPVTGSDLRAAVDALLAGEAMPADQQPSIGCNIKWRPGNAPA